MLDFVPWFIHRCFVNCLFVSMTVPLMLFILYVVFAEPVWIRINYFIVQYGIIIVDNSFDYVVLASRAFLRIACILLYMYHFFLICLYTTCVYNWRLGLIVVVSCTLRRVVCGRITGSLFGQNICLRSVCTFSFLVAFLSESLNYFLFLISLAR